MKQDRTIERYRMRTVLFHWIIVVAFIVLTLTGTIHFLSALIGETGSGGAILHRIAAMVFIVVPITYSLLDPKTSVRFLLRTFSWDRDDLRWFKAAPSYYFGIFTPDMPTQGYINTGQKLWQLVILITGAVFIVTGAMLWFLRQIFEPEVFQWILSVHGIAFVVVLVMFLVHIYMGILHPKMRGAFRSMLDGKIASSRARNHYRSWYEEVTTENRD